MPKSEEAAMVMRLKKRDFLVFENNLHILPKKNCNQLCFAHPTDKYACQ